MKSENSRCVKTRWVWWIKVGVVDNWSGREEEEGRDEWVALTEGEKSVEGTDHDAFSFSFPFCLFSSFWEDHLHCHYDVSMRTKTKVFEFHTKQNRLKKENVKDRKKRPLLF